MTSLWGFNEWHVVEPVATSELQLNDLVVTVNSARHSSASHLGTVHRNHSDVKDATIIQQILDRIKADFPIQ